MKNEAKKLIEDEIADLKLKLKKACHRAKILERKDDFETFIYIKRMESGIHRDEYAKRIGVTTSTMYRMEARTSVFSLGTITKLAAIHGLKVSEFFKQFEDWLQEASSSEV